MGNNKALYPKMIIFSMDLLPHSKMNLSPLQSKML
jgi:hypothetical protein